MSVKLSDSSPNLLDNGRERRVPRRRLRFADRGVPGGACEIGERDGAVFERGEIGRAIAGGGGQAMHRIDDVVHRMVGHDLQPEAGLALGHGGELDQIGEHAQHRQAAGDETRKRFHDADVNWDGAKGDNYEEGSKALEGLGVGSATGGTIGALIGAIAAIGTSVVFPGLGLVIAGPLAAAIAGAGVGGAAGGLVGALVGAGIPEERAVEYEQGLKDGGVVLGTYARDDDHASQLERDYQTYGAHQVRR